MEQSWVGPVIAVSLVILAACALLITAGIVLSAFGAGRAAQQLGQKLDRLTGELGSAIREFNDAAREVREVAQLVRQETQGYATTGRRLRRELERGVARIRDRIDEADALYEVVYGEVQDAALDVAATVRSFRTGRGALARVRRFLVPGR